MNASEFLKRRPGYTICFLGQQGSGKTLQAAYFPKSFWITTDPTGLQTITESANPDIAKLAANIVEVCPLNGVPLDEVFDQASTAETSVYGALAIAGEMAQQGRIKTLVFDNLTYFVKMLESHIKLDEDPNPQAAWGKLGRQMFEVVLAEMLPFATRYGCNVVIPIHLQRENEAAVKGAKASLSSREMQQGTGRMKRHVNLESDLSPAILGSFRDVVAGMPSAMIYLDNPPTGEGGASQYLALCDRQFYPPWDTEVQAKNRFSLPSLLDLTGKSFYAWLLDASKKAAATRQGIDEAKAKWVADQAAKAALKDSSAASAATDATK